MPQAYFMRICYLTDGRDWAYSILKKLLEAENRKWEIQKIVTTRDILFPKGGPITELGTDTVIVENPKEISEMYPDGFFSEFDILLFYGWSWIVPAEIVKNKICICLHPSPLPRYRGGSPIQHQIINGEKASAVSLFQMTEKLDDGPVYKQKPFALEGHLADIIKRIGDMGFEATVEMLDQLEEGKLKPVPQDGSKATIFKRRKKEESELTEEKLNKMNSEELFNFARALEDPYPNAFIKLKNGSTLLLKSVEASNPYEEAISIQELKNSDKEEIKKLVQNKLVIKCNGGGYIQITEAAYG